MHCLPGLLPTLHEFGFACRASGVGCRAMGVGCWVLRAAVLGIEVSRGGRKDRDAGAEFLEMAHHGPYHAPVMLERVGPSRRL